MPLQLNLLHEEILEQRQRKRDPLKISMYAAIGIAALLALNYLWFGYRTLEMRGEQSAAERDWSKVEPQVTAAQKRAEELNGIINTSKTLDTFIDGRFYWAPVLEKISHCVTPNLQITSLEGSADPDVKGVVITLDGIAGGREPRAVAEDFRQMLIEQLGKDRPGLKVEFKTLEDLDTLVTIGGASVSTAHFVVAATLAAPPKSAAPTERRRKPKDE